jgi:hypothetical protein
MERCSYLGICVAGRVTALWTHSRQPCRHPPGLWFNRKLGVPERFRTSDLRFTKPPLCQLSYKHLVDPEGIEPSTSCILRARQAFSRLNYEPTEILYAATSSKSRPGA